MYYKFQLRIQTRGPQLRRASQMAMGAHMEKEPEPAVGVVFEYVG